LIDHGEGNVDFEWFRSRGDNASPTVRYGDLKAFFAQCNSVAERILTATSESLDCDIDFCSLVGG
jgi:hypothetical protein